MEALRGKERVSQSPRERLDAKVQVLTFRNNLRSQKVILRSIESEINNESVSERILDSLEKLEQLYRELKTRIRESMIYSYAAVALACSFRGLPESRLENVFERRIPNLELINSEFVTDKMRVYRDGIRVLESIPGALYKCMEKEMNTKYKGEALMVLKCYLTEAMSPIEPALKKAEAELECLEAREIRDDNVSKETERNTVLVDKGIEDCRVGGGECQYSEVHGPKTREIQVEMLLQRQTANPRRYKRPAGIADSDNIDSEKMGASELKQATVSDPLINESIQSKKMGKQPLVGDPLIYSKSPNATVCSPLIDESIHIHLDSPKRKVISPKKRYEKKFRKIWSPEEEDVLREGVQKFGVGKWKLILDSNRDTFVGRREVDLKDKWRNLMRPISRR